MKNPIQQPTKITQEEIAREAYSIWEQRGRPDGRDIEFWLEAENKLGEAKPGATTQRAVRPALAPVAQTKPARTSQLASEVAPAAVPRPKSGGTPAARA